MKKGHIFYLVGISGSGKSTIANRLQTELQRKGIYNIQVIDGDVIRKQFGGIFGFTFEERMRCNQAVRVVLQYLVDNGIHVILSQVAGYQEMRDNMRHQFEPEYTEIYVKCSVEECARRDVKGYYKAGISNLNGKNDIYEIPTNSEIIVDTEQLNLDESVKHIMRHLEEQIYNL